MHQNDYPTGTVLKASINRLPFVYHYGIVINEGYGIYIAHNTPNEQNEYGGNVLIDELDTWTESRRIIEAKKTRINAQKIAAHIEKHKDKKFNLIFWNCEHFIFGLTKNRRTSPQLMTWINNLLLFAMIATTIYQNSILKKRLTQ
jgi:hypothetical protein